MHMHMTRLWRADAAVNRIDIADKVGGRPAIVKWIPPSGRVMGAMSGSVTAFVSTNR
jgi:hypothetical protein